MCVLAAAMLHVGRVEAYDAVVGAEDEGAVVKAAGGVLAIDVAEEFGGEVVRGELHGGGVESCESVECAYPQLSLQVFHGGVCSGAGRSLSGGDLFDGEVLGGCEDGYLVEL